MSKYYSLETLIEAKRDSFCDMYDLEDFLDEISEEKVLKITRCKDCKYYSDGFCNHEQWFDDDNSHTVQENDFCSYAEPKEIEGE